MDGTIIVNYDEVYALADTLSTNIQSDILNESKNRYTDVMETIKRVDGSTDASFIAAAELNEQKTAAVCETLQRLITYIKTASQELQQEENEMAGQLQVEASKGAH